MAENHTIPAPEEWVLNMSRGTDYLTETSPSRIKNIRPFHHRYVTLQTQAMFDNLVDLYAQVFLTQWHHYREFMDRFPSRSDLPPHIYAARCYISIWFIDLYVCNRLAVKKLSPIAFKERYKGKLSPISHEYDTYLTLLNASIRPTLVKDAIDNARYIPIIAERIDADDNHPNPFGINNFTHETFMFYGFTQIMKETNLWNFTLVSNDARGRPCWLFDWHSKHNVCSWFPDKDNYDMGDVALAYILGTACTPKLGVRDVDEWQYFAQGLVPHHPNPLSYDRVVKRQFYGSYVVRAMEIDAKFSLASILAKVNPTIVTDLAEKGRRPMKKPRKNDPTIAITTNELGEESQEVDQPMAPQFEVIHQTIPRFRLMEWVYYSRVILRMDNDSRIMALRLISRD